jgi:hypothetical protein
MEGFMAGFVGGALIAGIVGIFIGSTFARARRARKDYVAGVKAVPGLRKTQFREFGRFARFGVVPFLILLAVIVALRWDDNGGS